MAQIDGPNPEKQVTPGQKNSASESKASVRSSLFKYYIHDSADSCRLQLIGELSEADLRELNGCWTTAKTILGSRKLVLDVRDLKSLDDAGRQWIISMANEGAGLLPDTFLRHGLAGHLSSGPSPKMSLLARVIAAVRGSRALPTQSSTQAQ